MRAIVAASSPESVPPCSGSATDIGGTAIRPRLQQRICRRLVKRMILQAILNGGCQLGDERLQF